MHRTGIGNRHDIAPGPYELLTTREPGGDDDDTTWQFCGHPHLPCLVLVYDKSD
jgi:hypothetical protein